ncbi:hypothetical protein LPJ59_000120 [Coemansia sp. RSA 2399]|nr:hypothetical protein LPJ59_000120 [Coemansia sp. RSA 2399]KAJ1908402.1 hypothetical protein LPJ81_000111 [Coemansia sp. IMI 209127]
MAQPPRPPFLQTILDFCVNSRTRERPNSPAPPSGGGGGGGRLGRNSIHVMQSTHETGSRSSSLLQQTNANPQPLDSRTRKLSRLLFNRKAPLAKESSTPKPHDPAPHHNSAAPKMAPKRLHRRNVHGTPKHCAPQHSDTHMPLIQKHLTADIPHITVAERPLSSAPHFIYSQLDCQRYDDYNEGEESSMRSSPLPPPLTDHATSYTNRKRSGSEAATHRSTRSSGTYADDTVAASINGAAVPQGIAADVTPRKRSGKQKKKHQRRRSRSGSSMAPATVTSPVSMDTLTEESTEANCNSSSSNSSAKKKNSKESYDDELLAVDTTKAEPLTVATVSVSAAAADEDTKKLATLVEEEDVQASIPSLHQSTASLIPEASGQDRCATHPGTRNDLWCQTCESAICSRCIEGIAGHRAHSVVKLSVAYDDTYEAIEALQLQLVSSLAETRHRTALLDGALSDLDNAFAQASNQLDQRIQGDARTLEAQFDGMHGTLEDHQRDCLHWREGIEETLATVQSIMEQMSQAQAVAQREPVLRLMVTAVNARPQSWENDLMLDYTGLMRCVRPSRRYFAVSVPSIVDLGRKRGHVRVAGDPAPAHGAVWAAEVRRSRNELGEPCVAVTVTCVEGPAAGGCNGTYIVGVGIAGLGAALTEGEEDEEEQHFAQWHSAEWEQGHSHTFTVCTLDDLDKAGVISSSDGGIVVRVGVQPESFRALASTQAERIHVLEERLRKAEKAAASAAESRDDGVVAEHALCSVGKPSRRKRSDSRGWATSPRPGAAQRRSDAHQMFGRTAGGSRRPSLAPTLPLPMLPPSVSPPLSPTHLPLRSPSLQYEPHSCLADEQPLSHRRAVSLTAKLRRQPPIPFPLTMRTHSVQSSVMLAPNNGSQMSVSSKGSSALARLASSFGDDDKPGMLRRLSGWMREGGRGTQRARRGRQLVSGSRMQLSEGESSGEEIDDWTFLDSEVLSPREPREPAEPADIEKKAVDRCAAPLIPLPPIPAMQAHQHTQETNDDEGEEEEDGFSFDGAADIEREQAAVDARRATHSQGGEDLQARYNSIVQRIDAIQLIANTVENSRDGLLTEGTMRRISSELGVLMDGRRRRIEDARARAATTSTDLSLANSNNSRRLMTTTDNEPYAREGGGGGSASRRSFSMDPADIRRAVAHAMAADLPPANDKAEKYSPAASPPSKHNSNRRVSISSSSSRGGARTMRRDSTSAASDAEGSQQQQQQQQQLTPQTRRQGGILKAGRTRRVMPTTARLQPLPGLVVTPDDSTQRRTSEASSSRALRSASNKPVDRKHVRFPEEQRLLETIRLVDPQIAQSIETRVAATKATGAPTGGRSGRATSSRWSSDSEEEEAVPVSGLAARVRSSPRLSPRPSLMESEDSGDDGSRFDTATSVLFDVDLPRYKRPPRPPLHMVLGHDLLPAKEPSASAASVPARHHGRRHGVPLAVGPNVGSAQSSPVVPISGSNISSPMCDMAVGSAVSRLSDVSVFGDDQIPAAACGRNTALLADASAQGPDPGNGSKSTV